MIRIFKMENLEKLLKKISNKNILIIGDIFLYEYIKGSIDDRFSGNYCPKLNINNRYFQLGGAGYVAALMKTLGIKAHLFSLTGKDDIGMKISELLKQQKIDIEWIFMDSSAFCRSLVFPVS